VLFAWLTLVSAGTAHADPNALWDIVHGQCVPNEEHYDRPEPCALVELRAGEGLGYAVLKDLVGDTQFLLIPTARIAGIESPALLSPGAPNYFESAWESRTYVDDVLGRALPRDDFSLAINSAYGRTQNQLHIHIDCVRSDVRDALRGHEAAIGYRWAPLDIPLAGHRYMAVRVAGDQLNRTNPFKLLADGVPGAREDMGRHTLVVVGAVFSNGRPGFIVLDDHADAAIGDRASGEELQDHACAIASAVR
jgi:CDP-diacylglycerol pyrophosphatase